MEFIGVDVLSDEVLEVKVRSGCNVDELKDVEVVVPKFAVVVVKRALVVDVIG